jgi:hypothetical protein
LVIDSGKLIGESMGILDIEFKWENRELLLKELPYEDTVRFALFCARSALYVWEEEFPEDNRPRLAIQAAERWLEDPIKQNTAAAYAAYTAAAATYAARAAYAAYAARAAYAADAADAAAADAAAAAGAYAAYAAADAAYAAAAAAGATNKETLIQEQMDYLRELIIKNLPEEDRDCWLLIVASL